MEPDRSRRGWNVDQQRVVERLSTQVSLRPQEVQALPSPPVTPPSSAPRRGQKLMIWAMIVVVAPAAAI